MRCQIAAQTKFHAEERFAQPRAKLVQAMLEQARERGGLAGDADLQLALGFSWQLLLPVAAG
jgi:hypothetical protein